MGHVHDSAQRDEHQRLVDQYTEIARLAGGLAHEIKNPLSTIRLNMELLAEDFSQSDSPRDKRALAKMLMVQAECDRLQAMLDDFLNFTKVRQLDLKPTDLNSEVRRLLEFFAPQADEKRIKLIPYLRDDLPKVMLDREQFRAALLNLLINAQQAMPGGGELVVATETTPRGVALALIDNGVGMDEKTRANIFQAFYSTKQGGSGLGLPTARKIIEGHGGIIACQSEVGRGTRFVIELPTVRRIGGE